MPSDALSPTKLDLVLRSFLLPDQPSEARPLGAAGGLSGSAFWRFRCGDRELVLRRWPPAFPADRLAVAHAALAHARNNGLQLAPALHPTKHGGGCHHFRDHAWEVADWLPGEPIAARATTQEQVAAGSAALARWRQAMQSLPGRLAPLSGPAPALAKRLQAFDNASDALLPGASPTTNDLAQLGRDLTACLPQVQQATRNAASSPRWLQVIHGDARREHLLFSDGEVTGLIDFGAVCVDSPLVDLARWLSETAADSPPLWRAGLDAYHSVCPLRETDRRLVSILAISGAVAAGLNWLRWSAEHAASPPGQDRVREVGGWVARISQWRHAAQLVSTPG